MARSTPVSDLEPRDRFESEETLSGHQRHGTRGARPDAEAVAEELRRKGAFLDGEHVSVLHASTFRVNRDGKLEGEAEVSHSRFADPKVVEYDRLKLPSDGTARRLGPSRRSNVPAYYGEELSAREEILDSCPIDVYCSSINPRWGWRHKLMSYYEARPGVTESCDTLIIDSGYNRWGSPEDVLAAAAKTDADYVMATDVTGLEDPSNRDHNDSMPTTRDPGIQTQMDAALEGLRRFMTRAGELGITDRVILPLQPPYQEFITACKDHGWLSDVDYVSVGGLLTISDVEDRIQALHGIRERLGDEYRIHALAPGRDPEMMAELREHPGLIDSLDNSTPEQAPGNDKIPDATGKQTRHFFPRGTHASTLRGAAAVMVALETAQMLSPLCNAEDTFEETPGWEAENEPTVPDEQQIIDQWADENGQESNSTTDGASLAD